MPTITKAVIIAGVVIVIMAYALLWSLLCTHKSLEKRNRETTTEKQSPIRPGDTEAE